MNKKEQQAIDFLRSMERDDPMCLGFSGGKDSVVILDLAERSGIKYNASYANTTVDPPGTISFIKKNYSQVQILHPKKSFFQLVESKGLPGRMRRFCCEKLKEQYGIGQRTIEGMRAEESQSRALYEPEQCDVRKWMKGAKHILPILTGQKLMFGTISENMDFHILNITMHLTIFPVMVVLVVLSQDASRCRRNLRYFPAMLVE